MALQMSGTESVLDGTSFHDSEVVSQTKIENITPDTLDDGINLNLDLNKNPENLVQSDVIDESVSYSEIIFL